MTSVFVCFLTKDIKRFELKKPVNNATVLAMVVVTDTEVCLNKKSVMQSINLNHASAKCISITEQWSQRVTWCNINHNQHVIAKTVPVLN
jgi:hypothetical protein